MAAQGGTSLIGADRVLEFHLAAFKAAHNPVEFRQGVLEREL